ncbi:MAG: hypothetical protein ACLT8E_05545 [Akkermansia sp.]
MLTGDVMTIPREVRLKAEAMYPEGTADRERIAACVMQSWVADSGTIPRERIRRDWKSIREQVARQYGASGKSDDELFVAVSMHNQVRLSRGRLYLNCTRRSMTARWPEWNGSGRTEERGCFRVAGGDAGRGGPVEEQGRVRRPG